VRAKNLLSIQMINRKTFPERETFSKPYWLLEILKSELQPVGAKDDLAAEGDKNNQQDKTAAAAGAGYSPAKAKTILKPIKYHIQHK